jgi:EAL domain
VLDAALRQAAEWHRAGHQVSVAVNVSTRSLLDQAFPDQVAEQLAAWQVPARCLVLEITESAVMADPALALDVLGRLHEREVGLAIDDFGTGYSSMAYLKALPVDERPGLPARQAHAGRRAGALAGAAGRPAGGPGRRRARGAGAGEPGQRTVRVPRIPSDTWPGMLQ